MPMSSEIFLFIYLQFYVVCCFLRIYNRFLGHAVAQLDEAPRNKPEGRRFYSRLSLEFFIDNPSGLTMVDSAPNRSEYQEYFLGGRGGRCVGLTTLLPLYVNCLEIWEPQLPGNLRTCPGL
jgi:hypothetical protein